MSFVADRPIRAAIVAALSLVMAASCVLPVLAQTRTTVKLSEPTEKGRFEGTWVYVNRDLLSALWIREREDGLPEVRYRFYSHASPDAFETDWSGKAEYYVSGKPAHFAITLEEGDRNRLEGTWDWSVQLSRSGSEEKGRFAAYRGLDGRQLVFDFDGFVRTVVRGDDVRKYDLEQHSLTFTKVSKRIVLWEELPF